jgi:bacteriocin-like protein
LRGNVAARKRRNIMAHTKNYKNTTNELSNKQLEQVTGGNSIDWRTRHNMPDPSRPNAGALLMADRLGQVIPGQWNPAVGGDDNNLPG